MTAWNCCLVRTLILKLRSDPHAGREILKLRTMPNTYISEVGYKIPFAILVRLLNLIKTVRPDGIRGWAKSKIGAHNGWGSQMANAILDKCANNSVHERVTTREGQNTAYIGQDMPIPTQIHKASASRTYPAFTFCYTFYHWPYQIHLTYAGHSTNTS